MYDILEYEYVPYYLEIIYINFKTSNITQIIPFLPFIYHQNVYFVLYYLQSYLLTEETMHV